MKILLLSYEYPPETGFGGIGTYAWYHARALARLGHEVHVLAGAVAAQELDDRSEEGVTVHRFRADGLPMRAMALLERRQLWWTRNRLENGWSMYRGLAALLRRQHFDIVEMPECGGEGLLINHLMQLPTVVRFHSPAQLIMDYYDVPPADRRWCARVEGAAMRGARGYTACSSFLASEVEAHLSVGMRPRVIHNGIDLGLFDATEQVDVRRRFGLTTAPIILFTGRMERRKGIEVCPEIVAAILERHDVSFVFAGRDLFGYMERTFLPALEGRPLRGRLHYVGNLDLATVRSCLRQADIFFLPSLWENCPYSCLEAMAAGRAIVCSDQGGMPEIVRDGQTGLLAKNGDPTSYIDRLERLIDDVALRDRLGQAARRLAEDRFTDLQIARESVEFYEDVAAGRAAAAR